MHRGSTDRTDMQQSNVTWRAILLGLLLIPINVYWVVFIESRVRFGGQITLMSLFVNTTMSLLIIVLINVALRRLSPKTALSQAELLTIFIMLNLATCIASEDFAQVLFATISHLFWFASPENEWARFFPYVPEWLSVRDRTVLDGFYNADSTLYTVTNLHAWMRPVIWWSVYIFAMFMIMVCINIIVKKQWIEREKLTYPVIQLPLTITEKGGSIQLFSNRLLWVGFAIAAAIDIINSLHTAFPVMPYLSVKLNLIQGESGWDARNFFTTKPWNALGWTAISFFPFMIGLSYFLPLDLSFSIWFFFLFRKAQRIASAMFGLQNIPGFPYLQEQSAGAMLGFVVALIWVTRRHIGHVVMDVFSPNATGGESQETRSYRWATLGLLCCCTFLLLFCNRAGMSVGIILLLYPLYFAISTAIARIRAELGPPLHVIWAIPSSILFESFGARNLGPANVILFSTFSWFDWHRVRHPMAHQLESFKMAERAGMGTKQIVFAMMLAIVFGTIASFWIMLDGSYQNESLPHAYFGWSAYNQLAYRMDSSPEANYPAVMGMGVGFLFTLLLMFTRMRFIWWPFHPAGYALSMSPWSSDYIWSCLIVSFLAKWALMRYGGLRLYRKAIPFFIGLVLGEFVVITVLNAISILFRVQTYIFWPF